MAPIVRRFNRICLLKDLFHNKSYARYDQGGNPRQVIEGSTVSSINCTTIAGILISNIKDVGQRRRGPSWKTWLVSGYAAQASAGASAAQVLVGCHCVSSSLASQTVSHALTGRVSKYLTSYSRLLNPPLLYVVHTLHTPTNQMASQWHSLQIAYFDFFSIWKTDRMTPFLEWPSYVYCKSYIRVLLLT